MVVVDDDANTRLPIPEYVKLFTNSNLSPCKDPVATSYPSKEIADLATPSTFAILVAPPMVPPSGSNSANALAEPPSWPVHLIYS